MTTSTPYPNADSPPQYAGADPGIRSASSSNDTINRVVQGAHEAVDRFAEKAGPAVERVKSGVGSMSETMRAKASEFGAIEAQWAESCRSTVREHPLATVAVALAAGALLSKLFSSSR